MKNILKYAIIISMTAIALQQSSFVQADEEEYELVKFCPLWPAEYVDREMGSHLADEGARYFIPKSFVANIARNGELVTRVPDPEDILTDSIIIMGQSSTGKDGCLPYIPVTNGDTISVTLIQKILRHEGRNITFLRDDAETWESLNEASSEVQEIVWNNPNFVNGTKRIVNIDAVPQPRGTGNLMPAASAILTGRANSLGWKDNEKYFVVTSNNKTLCPKGGSWHVGANNDSQGYRKICMSTGSHTRSKATFAHEIGHGIHSMHGGPSGSYTGDAAARSKNDKCVVGTGGGHSYHSREWTGGAAQEGFSDFVAAVVYNDYGSIGEYSISKPTYNAAGALLPSWTVLQLSAGTDGNYTRYTHNVCPPPSNFKGLGSRHDWLNFFWEIWNTPNTTARYSVVDINAIWKETTWDDQTERIRKTHAWCLPVTTAQSGEPGWTCKRYPWSHRDSENWGVYLGFLDDKPAVKHNTGKQWEDLVVTAQDKYRETNLPKYELFRDAAEKAGVTY